MAFNSGYPINYPQYFTPNYMQQQPQQSIQQPQQVQSGGFIPVPSEDVARNYPVAPGNSVTFKNENAPYVYTKTMGFSQLDRPIFEKYKLVREDDVPEETEQKNDCHCQGDIVQINDEIKKLWDEVNTLKGALEA